MVVFCKQLPVARAFSGTNLEPKAWDEASSPRMEEMAPSVWPEPQKARFCVVLSFFGTAFQGRV